MDLPDYDHVIRFVPPSRLLRDEEGKVIGLLPQAFKMRPEDKGALSVNWLEYFKHQDNTKNIEKSVNHFRSQRQVNKNSVYAIGNIGEIKSICRQLPVGEKIKIIHAPSKNNGPHSKIKHIPENDSLIMSVLSESAFPVRIFDKDLP